MATLPYAEYHIGKPGHEGYLRPDIAALPEILSAGGYRTLFSGKWHLGLTPEQDPHARGFQHSFALLQGAGNHYGGDISAEQKPGSTTYREDGKTLASPPKDYYSSDAFASRLIDQLRTRRAQAGRACPRSNRPGARNWKRHGMIMPSGSASSCPNHGSWWCKRDLRAAMPKN